MSLRYRTPDMMPKGMRTMLDAQAAGRRYMERAAKGNGKPRRASRDEEHIEQVEFMVRIKELAENDPRYQLAFDRTYAIPNGGHRSKRAAGRLKAEGVKPGVPDVFVSLPARGRHGLYIEMKSLTGYASREQSAWLQASIALGYDAHCCRGAAVALAIWRTYVEGTL